MHSTILINEFFPDPVGPDKGWEWIEIVNISEEKIDLSNWEIQVGGVRYNRAFRFPDESKIQPQEYILICEEYVEGCDYYTASLAMQNGIGKTDGVRILNNSGEVINTVLYSKPNRNELKNDHGNVENDENIIEMPEEGYSFSRKSFSNTGFSIQDFFVTNNPTPGKENVFFEKIVISEVGIDFVEFYSTKIPSNLNSWYIKSEGEKVFLENNFKNNFFFLKTTKPFKEITLHSPEDILIDSFSTKKLSPNFTYCRLNSLIDEDFAFCENTKGEKNKLKAWSPYNLLEVIQINSELPYIVETCTIYTYEDLFIISDQTAALGVKCNECEIDTCNIGEITSLGQLEILKEVEGKNIEIISVNENNYSELLNKIVILKGELLKSEKGFHYLNTEVGLVKTQGEYSKNNNYTLQGILNKNKNNELFLEHPITLKQEVKAARDQLEQTGDPLIFLIFFFILPFLLAKIFVKLATVSFK